MSQRVLVFDSDAAFADDVKHNFEQMGLDVDVANDGPSGLQLATAHKPSLILLSIELPGMNGFLVCKKIKKMAELENVPLVIMSSEVDQETFDQHKKLRTRANDYVRKPIEFPDLLSVVRGYVSANNALSAKAASPAPDPGLAIEEAFSMSDDEVIILPDEDTHGAVSAHDRDGAPEVAVAAPADEPLAVIEDADEPTILAEDAAEDAAPVPVSVNEAGSGTGTQHAALADPDVATGVIAGAAASFEPESVTSTETTLPSDSALPLGHELVPPPVTQGLSGYAFRESSAPRERESVPSLRSASQQVMRSVPPLESAAQAAAHAAEVDRLKRELSAADEKTQASERRAMFAEQRAVGAEKALDAAKRTGGASSRELLDLREQLNRKDRELLELRDQVTARDKHLIEASDRNLAVERELQDLRDTHSDLQRDLEKKSELVIALTGDKEAARKRLDDAKARAERNEAKVKELSTELDQLRIAQQAEQEQLTAEHADMIANLRREQAQVLTSLRVEQTGALEQLRQQHTTETDGLTAKYNAEIETLSSKYNEATAQRADAHASELSTLRAQHEQLFADQKRVFEDEQRELREEHSVATKSAADRAEQDKRAALDALRDELIQAHNERLADADRELRAAHAQELEASERRHSLQLGELTEKHEREVAALQQKLAETEAARTAVEEQRARTEAARAEFEAQLRTTTDERDRLSERSKDLSDQVARAQARSERDHELLDRVRKAMAIGLGLLEEQKHEPV
jgi:CheY-like chemotaxis protein